MLFTIQLSELDVLYNNLPFFFLRFDQKHIVLLVDPMI